jgi:hypothetical protein
MVGEDSVTAIDEGLHSLGAGGGREQPCGLRAQTLDRGALAVLVSQVGGREDGPYPQGRESGKHLRPGSDRFNGEPA